MVSNLDTPHHSPVQARPGLLIVIGVTLKTVSPPPPLTLQQNVRTSPFVPPAAGRGQGHHLVGVQDEGDIAARAAIDMYKFGSCPLKNALLMERKADVTYNVTYKNSTACIDAFLE